MTDMTLSAPIWEGERAPLAKAFIAAQKATESIKKAASNPAFKSKYADLAHVVEGVIPALNDAGVGVLQFPAFDGEWVDVTTTLLHESGASVTSTLRLRPSKLDPQGVGSAITYGRRYSLLAMTGTAPEDDDANAASGPRDPAPPRKQAPKADEPPLPSTMELAAEIDALETPEAHEAWAKERNPVLSAIPDADYQAILQHWKAHRKAVSQPQKEAA